MTELRRYDVQTDELIPVTQEWVDAAQRAMNRMHRELIEYMKMTDVERMLSFNSRATIEFERLGDKTPYIEPK